MFVRISDTRLDYLMSEDVPYIDLTSEILGITDKYGEIEYYTREECMLCGTEEVTRLAHNLGATVTYSVPSGTKLAPQEVFFKAEGSTSAIHMLWKVAQNIFDHLSAVATLTRVIVDEAHAGNESCEILTTRKSMPGAKDILTHAVTVGGAYPHRLGLSETVLVFKNHLEFAGGFEGFIEKLPQIKQKCIEKKIFVEANADQARVLARLGIDGIQFDKVPYQDLPGLVEELHEIDPDVILLADGGVNEKNARKYAQTGLNGLVTTAPFTAKPTDIGVRMHQK